MWLYYPLELLQPHFWLSQLHHCDYYPRNVTKEFSWKSIGDSASSLFKLLTASLADHAKPSELGMRDFIGLWNTCTRLSLVVLILVHNSFKRLLSWLLHKWRGMLSVTNLSSEITCQHFDWMLQSSSGQIRSVNKHMHYWGVIGGQHLVRIAPPSLPPHLVAGPLWWGGREGEAILTDLWPPMTK